MNVTAVPWTTLEVVVFVVQLLACLAATAFPLLFGLRAPWWRSALGMAQLFSSSVLALSLWISAVFRILRHSEIVVTETTGLWIGLFIFTSIGSAKLCLTLVMMRIQRGATYVETESHSQRSSSRHDDEAS